MNILAIKSLSSLLCASLILSVPTQLLANDFKEPMKCPSVGAIQKIGLNSATAIDNKKWIALKPGDKYDTENSWTFVMGEFSASNAMEALTKARNILTTLTFKSGPNKSGRGEWECAYQLADGYRARAMTPPSMLSF